MEIILNIITFMLITQSMLVVRSDAQNSGIGLLQAAIESARANRESLTNSADHYMKKVIPPGCVEASQEDIPRAESKERENAGIATANTVILPIIIDTMSGIELPVIPSLESQLDGAPSILPTKTTVQGYIHDLMKPAQETGAEIVEGAVKVGVDQAVSSITDSFKIDIYLVAAVLVIQIILFLCGAHLCFYVYQREREMRRYVKQQITLQRVP